MIKYLSLVLFVLFSFNQSGKLPDRLPRNLKQPPIDYLAELQVQNPKQLMNSVDRQVLVRLVVEAYVVSVRKHQDDLLPSNCQFYEIVVVSFPGIHNRLSEAGLYLGEATRYFYSFPEYKPIIESILDDSTLGKRDCWNRR